MKFIRKQKIEDNISPKRALIIYGPRRVGKTTLLEKYLDEYKKTNGRKKISYSTGDDINLRQLFQTEVRDTILDLVRPFDTIAIDEAQGIPSIGLGAKMIIDAFPNKSLILTGSSSFSLSEEIGEPLTGRHFTITLLPLSQMEMQTSKFELKNNLSYFLIYGSYPEVLAEPDNDKKIKILHELTFSQLFKDVINLEMIKSPNLLLDILKCLAYQIGSEVSFNEIAVTTNTDVKTVSRYIDMLEKMFIIKKVRGFSRNLRTEISKKSKYYFLDNGIRNAVISQFNPLSLRNDIGALWENFIFMELYKKSNIEEKFDSYYFWRTHAGQEIDIIKESNGEITAIECKWSEQTKKSAPSSWKNAYPEAKYAIINKENYLDYLL